MSLSKTILAVVLVAGLAACGGGKNASQNAANTGNAMKNPASSAGGAMQNAAAGARGAMQNGASNAMGGVAAAVPASVNCGAVQPVWVNTVSHVYHTSTDKFYGRTKHGVYMCPSAAAAEGDRPAGGAMGKHHHKSSGGAMQGSDGSSNQ